MSSAKRLAREILDTRRLALGHATSPQLTSSALDGGQLDITDGDGNRIGGLGLGDDGGFVIDYTGGPKPPKPSPPTVTADAGIFRIEWDGSFVNEGDEGILATSDTDRVEIHASMDENFVPDRVESFGGAFATLDGGSFTLGPLPEAGTYYFRLVARSKSAQFSEPSDRVEQELAITSIDLEITDAWLTGEAAQNTADGKNSIWRGPDEPEADPDRPFKDGDIWFEMTPDGKSIPNIWDEDAGAWVANDDYRQSEIEKAQQELREDLDAIVVDGSGTTNYYQGTPPDESSSPPPKEGDLWFDSSDSNKPYIYQDGEWITVRDSFSKAGAAERFASVRDKHSLDNWWSNVPGFALDSSVKPTVPSGASGDATIKIALQGSFDPAGNWVLDETGVSPNGLPIGIESQIYVKSSGGDPAGNFVFGLQMPGGNPASAPVPLDVVSGGGPFAGATHQLSVSATAKSYAEMYGQIAERMWFSIEITLPAAAAGDFIVFETLSASYLVPSTGIADKAITTEKIAAGAITAESGIIGSINAGTITVGEMDGARIKAQTIYSDKLLIGGDRNLIPNGDLDKGSSIGWPSDAEYQTEDVPTGLSAAVTFPSGKGASSYWRDRGGRYPVSAGDTLVFEMWIKADLPGSKFYAEVRDDTGAHLSASSGSSWTSVQGGGPEANGAYPLSGYSVPTEWTKVVSSLKVGGEAKEFYLGSWYFNHSSGTERNASVSIAGLKVYKQVGATLIQDGSIITSKIAAGAITAESGIIGSIDANVITVGKIMGNQLDADAINGKTITGAKIRTASSGSRVELTHNGLKQYNSLGATIVDMTAGSFTLQGGSITGSTIKTASSGSRVEITTQGLKQYNSSNEVIAEMVGGSMVMTGVLEQANSIAKLQVGPAFAQSVSPGLMWSNVAGTSKYAGVATRGGSSASLVAQGPRGSSSSGAYGYMSLAEGGSYLTYKAGGDDGNQTSYLNLTPSAYNLLAYNSSDILVSGLWSSETGTYLRDTASSGYQQDFYMQDRKIWTGWRNSGGTIGASLFLDNDGITFYVNAASRRLMLDAKNVRIPSLPGDTNAVPIGRVSGRLHHVNSARRFKLLEEPITDTIEDFEDKLLSVEAKTWIDRTRAERIADYETAIALGEEPVDNLDGCGGLERIPGVVAEDMEDAGLEMFVAYDDDGETSTVFYDRIGPALIPIVRRQRDRIEALEARIAALEVA